MTELTEVTGVGPARAESLNELGIETAEQLAEADPSELADAESLKRLSTDAALEMVVNAEEAARESEGEEETDDETITFDEEQETLTDEDVDEEEIEEEVEEEPEPVNRLIEVDLDLSDRQKEIVTHALLETHTKLARNNRSRSKACDRVLKRIRGGYPVELEEEELNAFYTAIREKRLNYQGNNHMDLMRETHELEKTLTTLREEELF